MSEAYKKLRFLIYLESPVKERVNLIGLILISFLIMFCGKSQVPIGSKVKIVKNIGNECEPFINMTGIATHPYNNGCKKENWIGVELSEDTIYGRNFNFHIDELEIYEKL